MKMNKRQTWEKIKGKHETWENEKCRNFIKNGKTIKGNHEKITQGKKKTIEKTRNTWRNAPETPSPTQPGHYLFLSDYVRCSRLPLGCPLLVLSVGLVVFLPPPWVV